MMTREDILRELELLPVWQLRTPVQAPQAEASPVTSPVNYSTQTIVATEFSYSLIVASDRKLAFIMPASPDLSALQATLFNNILQALKITKTNKTQITSLDNIEASLIIVMGEVVAQQLLNTQESLEQLRGKPHLLHNTPLIVTYHPNDCLQHLPYKAKTWDDLCAALSIMNA